MPPPLKTRGLDIAPREKVSNYEDGINLSKPEMSRSKMMSEQELLNYIFSSRNNMNGMPQINLDSSVNKKDSYQFKIPNLDAKVWLCLIFRSYQTVQVSQRTKLTSTTL